MAVAPVRNQLGFQRLDRVRARRRARHRRRLVLVATLVTGLTCAGVLGVAAVRRPTLARPGQVPMPAPAETVSSTTAISPAPAETVSSTTAISPAPAETVTSTIAISPAPPRVEAARRPTATVARPRPERTPDAAAPRDEPHEADPAEAIDWLLERSRTTGR